MNDSINLNFFLQFYAMVYAALFSTMVRQATNDHLFKAPLKRPGQWLGAVLFVVLLPALFFAFAITEIGPLPNMLFTPCKVLLVLYYASVPFGGYQASLFFRKQDPNNPDHAPEPFTWIALGVVFGALPAVLVWCGAGLP